MKLDRFTKLIILIFAVVLFNSCSNKVSKQDLNSLVIFPAPPEPTKIQYLMSFSSSTDIVGARSGFMKLIIGGESVLPILKPYGLAVTKDKIFVSDTKLGGLEIINLSENTFEYFKPGGLGEFKKPLNCFVDDENLLYIVDVDRKDIIQFDKQLQYVRSFGFNELIKPTDVYVKNDLIYVTDIKDHKVKIFSKKNYELVNSFPDVAETDTAFAHSPTNILVDDNGIYVTDAGEFVIKVYDLKGNFVRNVGELGKQIGQFARPKGIALDNDRNLYAVDAAFENVQIFDSTGTLLLFFGGSYKGPGYMYLPAKVVIDYNNLEYFRKYVHESFKLKYLIFVTNQFGPDKVSVYGFVEPK